jgi:hypothetical protein
VYVCRLRTGSYQGLMMRWEKGQSGNPGGRPKGHGDLRELARQYTEDALEALVEICRNGENEGARVAAANALLDRGWGKPPVAILAPDPPAKITLNFGWERQARAIASTDCEPVRQIAPAALGLASPAHPDQVRDECLYDRK